MSAAYSKLSAKVVQQAVKEVGKEQHLTNLPEQGGNSPFKQMLNSLSSGTEIVHELGLTNNQIGLPHDNIQAISASGIDVDTANIKVGLEQPKGIDKVVDLLSEVNDGQMQMENMVNQILYSGKRFSNQELLAIQAHVFHFAQVTELVVKTADQGVSSLKTVMNTNIQ